MRPMVIVSNEYSSEIYFPAMLRLRRHSVVTAMISMTVNMIRQRTRVGAALEDVPWPCIACGERVPEVFKRFFGPVVSLTARLPAIEAHQSEKKGRAIPLQRGPLRGGPGRLPDELQSQLNLPRSSGRLIQRGRQRASVEVEER